MKHYQIIVDCAADCAALPRTIQGLSKDLCTNATTRPCAPYMLRCFKHNRPSPQIVVGFIPIQRNNRLTTHCLNSPYFTHLIYCLSSLSLAHLTLIRHWFNDSSAEVGAAVSLAFCSGEVHLVYLFAYFNAIRSAASLVR